MATYTVMIFLTLLSFESIESYNEKSILFRKLTKTVNEKIKNRSKFYKIVYPMKQGMNQPTSEENVARQARNIQATKIGSITNIEVNSIGNDNFDFNNWRYFLKNHADYLRRKSRMLYRYMPAV